MADSTVTPREWLRQWLSMLDARRPGWRSQYDREAFELAVEDLFGSDKAPSLGEEGMEVLGEFTMRHDEETSALSSTELKESPEYRRAMIEFEYIFRSSHGSSRDSAELREMRKRTLKNVVDAVLEPMLDRLVRMARAREMRERRRLRKHPRIARAEPYRDPRSPSPEAEIAGREAAARTVSRARRELSPAAFDALCRFFGDREGRPACDAARSAGISPATMTRALRALQDLSAREFEGCPDGARAPFAQALSELLEGQTLRPSPPRPQED
jgi:hypothetical protein